MVRMDTSSHMQCWIQEVQKPNINPNPNLNQGKVRRVCEAAAKFWGLSLNSLLVSGPDLLKNLVGIFMRFREKTIVLSGDIEAMFIQVAVPPEDQVVLRLMWWQTPESEREVYQYLHYIFWAKCAPTCSNNALVRSAENNEDKFPGAALAVKEISTWMTSSSKWSRAKKLWQCKTNWWKYWSVLV